MSTVNNTSNNASRHVPPDAQQDQSSFGLTWWAAVLILFFILGITLNWQGLHAGFVSDDFQLVDTARRDGPFASWTHTPAPFFRPLISLSLWLNFKADGLDPLKYHLANVVIHVFNSLLVTVVSLPLLRTLQWRGNSRRAALAAGCSF